MLPFLSLPFYLSGLHFAAKMLRQARTPLLPTKKGPTDATLAVHSLPLIRRRLRARSQFLKKKGGGRKRNFSFFSFPFGAGLFFFAAVVATLCNGSVCVRRPPPPSRKRDDESWCSGFFLSRERERESLKCSRKHRYGARKNVGERERERREQSR